MPDDEIKFDAEEVQIQVDEPDVRRIVVFRVPTLDEMVQFQTARPSLHTLYNLLKVRAFNEPKEPARFNDFATQTLRTFFEHQNRRLIDEYDYRRSS